MVSTYAHYVLLVNLSGSVISHVIQTVQLDIIKTQDKDFANNVILHAYIVMVRLLKIVQNVKQTQQTNTCY